MTPRDLAAFFYHASLPFTVLGLVGFTAYAWWRHPAWFRAATIATIIAFAGLSLELLALLAVHGHRVVMASAARYLMAAWTIMAVYFVAEARYRIRLLGSMLMPAALMLMLVAMFVPESPVTPPAVAGLGVFLAIHVTLIFLSFGLLFLAFGAAMLYLLKTRALKHRSASALDATLPALDTSRQLMERVFMLAFPLLTVGLILGAVFAARNLSAGWVLEPKVLSGLVIWMVYAGFYARQHAGLLSPPGLARGIAVLLVMVSLSFILLSHDQVWELLRAPGLATPPPPPEPPAP